MDWMSGARQCYANGSRRNVKTKNSNRNGAEAIGSMVGEGAACPAQQEGTGES
jgi:hypothetical protein